jgi:polyferredoxin
MLVQLNLKPDVKQLRQFGFIALAAFALIGAVVMWRGGLFGLDFGPSARPLAYGLWAIGGVSAFFSVVHPKANRALFVALVVMTYPIGLVVSHVALALLFFGILTPVAVWFRLMGRDPLLRKFEPERSSYWTDVSEVTDPKHYFRQF